MRSKTEIKLVLALKKANLEEVNCSREYFNAKNDIVNAKRARLTAEKLERDIKWLRWMLGENVDEIDT